MKKYIVRDETTDRQLPHQYDNFQQAETAARKHLDRFPDHECELLIFEVIPLGYHVRKRKNNAH